MGEYFLLLLQGQFTKLFKHPWFDGHIQPQPIVWCVASEI
jgi:hypothetical protein